MIGTVFTADDPERDVGPDLTSETGGHMWPVGCLLLHPGFSFCTNTVKQPLHKTF